MKKHILSVCLLLVVALLSGEDFRFKSDSLKSVFTDGREKTLLIGHVKIESDKRVIKAERVEMWGDNYRYFSGVGNIFVFDKEKNFEVTASIFFYDKKEDVMRLKKNILMQDYKNEMVIKAGFIENRGAENKIYMQVGVIIQKEDILCNSEFALYIRDDEFLELEGMPVVYKDGDTFKAELITVDLKTDNIILSGNVSGKLKGDEEKSPAAKPPEASSPESKTNVPSDSNKSLPGTPSDQPAIKPESEATI